MINFNGPMGFANAQRMLDYCTIVIVEFISQPEYKDSIPMFEIVNEGTFLSYPARVGADIGYSIPSWHRP
ncbi:hypothetical protein B0H14DRAFT_3076934 [Mycena olivaceomarginata]|nr:hypothetical protein B0H14DRAFT_3076934 [Mycena olivaceomarginata]